MHNYAIYAGFGVDVGVGVREGVLVEVLVTVLVGVRVAVLVGVAVGMRLGVGIGDRMPVPIRPTVGTGAFAVIVSVPVRVPAALGVNVTETLQLAPAPSELPQVVDDGAKSPLAVILEIKTSELPLLAKVTFLAAPVEPTVRLPNDRPVGDTVTHVPVPLRLAVWGLLSALLLTVSVPASVPVVVGLKVTEIVQLARGPRELPQVVEETAKSPLAAILEMGTCNRALLVRVMFCAGLLVPISW